MPNGANSPRPDLQEVTTRNHAARRIVATFAAIFPTLAPSWRTIDSALADVADLSSAFSRIRLAHADLLAAARATLGADRDGEPDPLSYLRDELHAHGWDRR